MEVTKIHEFRKSLAKECPENTIWIVDGIGRREWSFVMPKKVKCELVGVEQCGGKSNARGNFFQKYSRNIKNGAAEIILLAIKLPEPIVNALLDRSYAPAVCRP